MKLSDLIKELQLRLEKEPDLDKLELLVMTNEGYGYPSKSATDEILLSRYRKITNGKFTYDYKYVEPKDNPDATHVLLDFMDL